MGKMEKFSAWNLTKVKSKKKVIDEARTAGRYSSFCIINGHLSFEECRIGGKAPKMQRSSCKRQSGKSKVPAKQRGSWPKMCYN